LKYDTIVLLDDPIPEYSVLSKARAGSSGFSALKKKFIGPQALQFKV